MQQESFILFVDLGEEASKFLPTLKSLGLGVASVAYDEASAAIAQRLPRAVLAPEEHIAEMVQLLKTIDSPLEIPFFALGTKDNASLKHLSTPRGVTALMSRDVDPGVLCLRLQTALQQAKPKKAPQETLLGFGHEDNVGVSASKPASTVPPASSQKPFSLIPPVPGPPSASSSPHVAAPTVPGPALPSTPPVSASSAGGSTPNAVSAASSSLSSSARPVTTSTPTAASSTDAEIPPFATGQAASKAKLLRIGAAAAALLLVGGGALLLSGGEDSKEPSAAQDSAKVAEAAKTAAAATPAKIAPASAAPPQAELGKSDAKKADATEKAKAPKETDKSAEEEKAKEADVKTESSNDPDESLFKITSPQKAKSCDDLLEKSEEYYKKQAKWRGTQAWKLARKSLMRGKEEQAHKQMCESAFIDPSGPATAGLASFYLSRRALSEAHDWANRAVKASSGAKRAAKELLADVLCQMGKVKEARALWLESFNLTADDEDRLAAVGRRFVKSARKARRGGDAPLAERLLRRAAAFNPDDSTTAAALASVLLKNEEDDLAKRWAEHALSLDSNSKVAKHVISKLDS